MGAGHMAGGVAQEVQNMRGSRWALGFVPPVGVGNGNRRRATHVDVPDAFNVMMVVSIIRTVGAGEANNILGNARFAIFR